ncbi:MAG: translation initiation factor IF-2 [archaeon]
MPIRSPIVTFLGHVDHGKTSLLDAIRNTSVLTREVGGITQMIGASEIPSKYIVDKCGEILKILKTEITIPGLVVLDTPGHKAFLNLRRRGGELADIAVLVIDIRAGFQPQTLESLKILKLNKTPFVIAATKVDLLHGWQSEAGSFLENSRTKRSKDSLFALDQKIYEIVADVGKEGLDSERYDRVSDFTKTVAIVPVSSKTGEGIPDLMALLAGLSQKFLANRLEITPDSPAKGTVLEVKQERGQCAGIDVVIYDGTLKVGDVISIGGVDGPVEIKVRALLKPKPLDEIRDPKDSFESVREIVAAGAVKILASGCENVMAGSMLLGGAGASEEIQKQLENIQIRTEKNGVIIKADSIGSLEAMGALLSEAKISINGYGIGGISRKDVVEAEELGKTDEFFGIVLGFLVTVNDDAAALAKERKVPIILNDVIYKIVEGYQEFVKQKVEEKKKREIEGVPRGARFQVLPGYVFRQSKPAVVGVEVSAGILRKGVKLLKEDGSSLGLLSDIQVDGKSVESAEKGKRCAVSIEGAVVGRSLFEQDVIFPAVPEETFKKLLENKKFLSSDELEALDGLAAIMRRKTPSWGMHWG